MSKLALKAPPYKVPEGLEDFGDRIVEGKKVILYIAETAFVDIVERTEVDTKEVLGALILRVESTPDRAIDLLHHTSLFLPEEEANRIFGNA